MPKLASPARKAVLRASVVVACLLVVAAVATALLSRGDLDSARDRVDRAWAELHPMLTVRYDALTGAGTAAEERLGRTTDLLDTLDETLVAWETAETAAGQLGAANRLEGLAARLSTVVDTTPRLKASAAVRRALQDVRNAAPDEAREAYNRSVAAYERHRGGWIRRLLAGALGFGASRSLESPAT
jgi:hypothetical protein